MRDVFAAELATYAARDDRIMFITGDLGFGVFEEFSSTHPDQYLNVGVAEQNMVAVATGLALEGRTSFVYSIGNFPVLRCLEQIRNDAAYHDAAVKIVSIGGGFSYGPLGMSHHATEDIAVMRAIPQVRVFTPGTLDDVAATMSAMVAHPGTEYLRLDKASGEESVGAEGWTLGRWRIMSEGDDVALVAAGGVLGEAQQASEVLKSRGVSARVVNATQLSPIDTSEVLRALGPAAVVLTLEEHVITGGLAGAVAEAIAVSGHRARLVPIGIGDAFMSTVGSQTYLRGSVGLGAEAVAARAAGALRSCH